MIQEHRYTVCSCIIWASPTVFITDFPAVPRIWKCMMMDLCALSADRVSCICCILCLEPEPLPPEFVIMCPVFLCLVPHPAVLLYLDPLPCYAPVSSPPAVPLYLEVCVMMAICIEPEGQLDPTLLCPCIQSPPCVPLYLVPPAVPLYQVPPTFLYPCIQSAHPAVPLYLVLSPAVPLYLGPPSSAPVSGSVCDDDYMYGAGGASYLPCVPVSRTPPPPCAPVSSPPPPRVPLYLEVCVMMTRAGGASYFPCV
jgi:hypothetical protein